MPISGSPIAGTTVLLCTTTLSRVTPIKRALQWSHSEVFVTPYGTSNALESMNVADLTTVHTPDQSCVERWMLIPQPTPSCGTGSTAPSVIWSVNPLRSIVSDISYNKCQLYGTATYSPGVCPSGQTVAEVTAYASKVSNGTRTFWQASCCRSDMGFGPEYANLCLSSFSTPVSAFAAIITSPAFDNEVVTPVYDYTSYYPVPSISLTDGNPPASTVISSVTTIATGLAAADPVIVAWQIEDVGSFPSEYVQSLVARYSIPAPIPAPASTSTATTSALEPTTAPASDGLSTGTQVGIVIGVALAAALAGGLLIFWCLRHRRNAAGTEEPDVVIPEMEDQDHIHTERRWHFGGRWRSEIEAQPTQNELDSTAVYIVPGPPSELEVHKTPAETTENNDGKSFERV